MYVFKERLKKISIWKNLAGIYSGKYRIIREFVKVEPVYRDNYIEPCNYKRVCYVEFKNVDTGTRFTMDKNFALWVFEEKRGG